MKVGILYICTGKYSIFWDDFYTSCEKYFLPDSEKKYFVFSDTLNADQCGENVRLIYQEKMGWPKDTLMRFHLFNSIEGDLLKSEYIFFFNANIIFNKRVGNSILRLNNQYADLIVVSHPFFQWVKDPSQFPYERRKISRAYMNKKSGKVYAFGAFNGGKSGEYIKMVDELKFRIDGDLEKGIVAIWHDESHLNKYVWEYKGVLKILGCNYAFPQQHDLSEKNDVFITVLDKNKFGGHDFLRDKDNSIPQTPQSPKGFFEKIKDRLARLH